MSSLGTACYIGAASDGAECDYCSPSGGPITNFRDASFTAASLTCEGYQLILDRGWMRSGLFCYKPDLKRSCCPAYAMKLDTVKFKPSASQRKLISRWNWFVLYGDGSNDATPPERPSRRPSHTKKGSTEYSFIQSLCAPEKYALEGRSPVHKFEITLESPNYTDEKYKLFKVYQEHAHQGESSSSYTFRKFLTKTPLQPSPIPYRSTPPEHLPNEHGTYHQMYRLDGKLIAMATLDILPSCVSSVYFVYDPAWERYSLGKLSALREIALVKEIRSAGVDGYESLHLGYYVHTCQKMRYKAEYSPSYLLDPEEYTWWPVEVCLKQLNAVRYACFAHPEHSLQEHPERDVLPPVSDDILEALSILKGNEAGEIESISFHDSKFAAAGAVRAALSKIIHFLGIDIAKRMNFVVEDWK